MIDHVDGAGEADEAARQMDGGVGEVVRELGEGGAPACAARLGLGVAVDATGDVFLEAEGKGEEVGECEEQEGHMSGAKHDAAKISMFNNWLAGHPDIQVFLNSETGRLLHIAARKARTRRFRGLHEIRETGDAYRCIWDSHCSHALWIYLQRLRFAEMSSINPLNTIDMIFDPE